MSLTRFECKRCGSILDLSTFEKCLEAPLTCRLGTCQPKREARVVQLT